MNLILQKVLGLAENATPAVIAAASAAAGPYAPLVGFAGTLIEAAEKKFASGAQITPATAPSTGGVAPTATAKKSFVMRVLTDSMPIIEALFAAHGQTIPDQAAFLSVADNLVEDIVMINKTIVALARTVKS